MRNLILAITFPLSFTLVAQDDTLASYCKTNFIAYSNPTIKETSGNFIYYLTDKNFYLIFDTSNTWVNDSLKIFEPLILNNTINAKTLCCYDIKNQLTGSSRYSIKKGLFKKDTIYSNYIFTEQNSQQILVLEISYERNKSQPDKMTFEMTCMLYPKPEAYWWTFELSLSLNEEFSPTLKDFIEKGTLTCIGGPAFEL